MATIAISHTPSNTQATIAPELGFNLFQFSTNIDGQRVETIEGGLDVLKDGGFSQRGTPILCPFPNRIRKGKFEWEGKSYELAADKVGYNADNAIHGFCLDKPWRIVAQDQNSVEGEFQLSVDAPERLELWPADFTIRMRYEVGDGCLNATATVTNVGENSMPFGIGFHPYFQVPYGADSKATNCTIQVPVKKQWDLIECMPTGGKSELAEEHTLGEGVYFGMAKFDDLFSDVEANGDSIETVIIDEQAGIQMTHRFDSSFQFVVLYTPPERNSFCIEPYTCITDALNLHKTQDDTGLLTLEAGESFVGRFSIQVGRVIA